MDEMTSAELNQYLENIAKLIEANVKEPRPLKKPQRSCGTARSRHKKWAARPDKPPPTAPKR